MESPESTTFEPDDLVPSRSRRLRRERLRQLARRRLPAVQYALDALVWGGAVPLAALVRFDMDAARVDWAGVLGIALLAAFAQGAVGYALGLYRRHFHYGSFEELRSLAASIAGVAIISSVVAAIRPEIVPRTTPAVAACFALIAAAVVRYFARLASETELRPARQHAEPIIVFGAGNAGRQIIRTMLLTPDSPYLPVGLLDDDPLKSRLRIGHLRVEGTRADIQAAANRHLASTVLIAIPSANGDQLRALTDPLVERGLNVLVLPPVGNLLGTVGVADIRPVTIDDLLGRHPADIDVESIADYVRGRTVLVTGAGGSIGSELCRQLHRYAPAKVVMLDRDESGLHGVELSISGRALLDSPHLALADIRDEQRMVDLFEEHRPDVVFHAAALKHQPLLELHPSEAWKTNVVGTYNVLEAAKATGVSTFVNISTDKAADPIGALGYSKRICERLTAQAAQDTGRPYVSVRFGNVLGSKGSMLLTFQQQVEGGGPITVTDPNVTRYFMLVEEAVALTIQAGAIGRPGEVLVLDMGKPVRILDVAERLAGQAPRPVEIVFTGLRPGEKLHEVLFAQGEIDQRPLHPLVSHVAVAPLTLTNAASALRKSSQTGALSVEALRRAAVHESDVEGPERPIEITGRTVRSAAD